jgi:hypothetical protein
MGALPVSATESCLLCSEALTPYTQGISMVLADGSSLLGSLEDAPALEPLMVFALCPPCQFRALAQSEKMSGRSCDHCAAAPCGSIQNALRYMGKHAPRFLAAGRGSLCQDALRGQVIDAWSGTEYPYVNFPRDMWLAMFRAIGYTCDGEPAERPAERVTLYRGVLGTATVRGMSWTTDLEKAWWFARRHSDLGVAMVYQSIPPVTSLLAYIGDRNESEYVVDPRGIRVEKLAS